MKNLPVDRMNLGNLSSFRNAVRDAAKSCTNVERYDEFSVTCVWFEVWHGSFEREVVVEAFTINHIISRHQCAADIRCFHDPRMVIDSRGN